MPRLHDQEIPIVLSMGTEASLATTAAQNSSELGEVAYGTDTKKVYVFDGVEYVSVATGEFDVSLHAPDGSAAAPSFSFASDPDTGMYRSGANVLGFTVGGSVRLTVSSSGIATLADVFHGGNTNGRFTSMMDLEVMNWMS